MYCGFCIRHYGNQVLGRGPILAVDDTESKVLSNPENAGSARLGGSKSADLTVKKSVLKTGAGQLPIRID